MTTSSTVEIGPGRNSVIHTHGGAGAMVRRVELVVDVPDDREHAIEIRRVELLVGHCNADDWLSRTPLAVDGYILAGEEPRRGNVIAIPASGPRQLRAQVTFPAIEVYYACERFAFAVELVVDRVPRSLEVPLDVQREEPER